MEKNKTIIEQIKQYKNETSFQEWQVKEALRLLFKEIELHQVHGKEIPKDMICINSYIIDRIKKREGVE